MLPSSFTHSKTTELLLGVDQEKIEVSTVTAGTADAVASQSSRGLKVVFVRSGGRTGSALFCIGHHTKALHQSEDLRESRVGPGGEMEGK